MNTGLRALLALASISLLGGLSGCIVDFDPTEPNAFACEEDGDCLPPNKCIEGVCRPQPNTPPPSCVDEDLDGYGEGDACLGLDCDDTNAATFPDAPELCDGQDNDCDCAEDDSCADPAIEIVDEVNPCEADEDCPNDPKNDNGMRCLDNVCIFRCPLDTVGVCGTAGPDGQGAVRTCQTVRDENTGVLRGEVPVCALVGAYGPNYNPGPEDQEACDGLDNNCNRRIDGNDNCLVCDDENPRECSTDLGVCSKGILRCIDNVPDDCVDPMTMEDVVEPGDLPEVCNGEDDDCNGVADNAPNTPMIAGSICPDRCPFGMVLVNNGQRAWCVDRFEASRPDAGFDSPGVDNSRAVSRPGVIPWTNLTLTEARDACRGPAGIMFAARRLCKLDELQFACGGANRDLYPYGDTFTAQTCNGVAAGLGRLAPTGPTETIGDQDFAACVSTRGEATLYDLSGNAAEFALDNNLGKIFGGSFISEANALTCQAAIDGQGPAADVGFRCCFDP